MTVLPLGKRCPPQASSIGVARQIIVGDFPNTLPSASTSITLLPLVRQISVLPLSKRIAVNGQFFASRPPKIRHVGRELFDNLSPRRVFLDLERQQMRDQIVAIGQFAGHPRLHVGVVGFRLQRKLQDDLAV